MPSDEELLAIKERAVERLMALDGVNGVGIGGRVRGGERINEVVLKVYVGAKLPAAQVDPAALIPAEFEGVPTDVVEQPAEGVYLQAPPGKPEIPVSQIDGRRMRPLTGGTRIEVDLSGAGSGTLGCMLVPPSEPGKAYALTNWHVLEGEDEEAPTVGTTKAGQPTSSDSVTKCCSAIIGKVAGGGRDTVRDAGIVQLEPGMEWFAEILEIGPISGQHQITPTEAGAHPTVRKRGARSGLTGGTVESIASTRIAGGTTHNNVIVVTPNADSSLPAGTAVFFDQPGDSGSALVNEANEVVGLVFAMAGPKVTGGKYEGLVPGWALPIDDIISGFSAHESLTLKVAVAVLPGVHNTVPGAAMAAMPPEVAAALQGAPAADFAPAPDTRPARVPVAAMAVEAPPQAALAQLQQGLDRSERGRALITLWLTHQRELLELLDSNRRVATAWHRSGASALFQLLVRMLSQPELELPSTLNGRPLGACVERVCASIERFASAALRDDLADLREELPELGGRSLSGVFAALGAG